ncbi:MAG: DUF1028 domain-containing protein [Myxococcota bacterium]
MTCRLLLFAIFFGACLSARSAHATWSIVAADPQTGQLGGAGTSCVGDLDVRVIFGAAPGKGAVHAQARLSTDGRDQAVSLLEQDQTPAAIIAAITDARFDPRAAERQYGVVSLSQDPAAWTGEENGSWAGDVQGAADGIRYSAQGNILTGAPVVTRTADAFAQGQACDLAERLLVALTAGRDEGQGDSRCTDAGVPSDSAFLIVIDADGQTRVDLSVVGTGRQDPLALLRADFDRWREDHPCPDAETEESSTASEESPESGPGCRGGRAALLVPLMASGLLRRRRTPDGRAG